MIQHGNERTLPTRMTGASPVQMTDACYAILRAQLNSPLRAGQRLARTRRAKAACIRLRPQKIRRENEQR